MKKIYRKILLIFPVIIAVICMGGCAGQEMETDFVVAKFGEEKIRLSQLEFYLIINQVDYERTYAEQYPGEDIWQKDILGTGNTLENDVKQSIMQEEKRMCILLKKADELGITLDVEDEEELIVLEEIFKERYGEEILSKLHSDDGVVQERLRESMLAAKVKEVICKENGWTADDREERFDALYREWAQEESFTIREVDWSEVHFEQGKYKDTVNE